LDVMQQLSEDFPEWKDKVKIVGCECSAKRTGKADQKFQIGHGVTCSACLQPITGTRYQCSMCQDFHLCAQCEVKDLHDISHPRIKFRIPVPCVATAAHMTSGMSSKFVQNVSYDNGSMILPGMSFTKTWKVKNNGQSSWPPNTVLVNIGGEYVPEIDNKIILVPSIYPGDSADISVELVAPKAPGRSLSYWQLQAGGVNFGDKLWMDIKVASDSYRSKTKSNDSPKDNRNITRKINKSISVLHVQATQNETESVSILSAMGFKGDVMPVLRQNRGDLMMTIKSLLN